MQKELKYIILAGVAFGLAVCSLANESTMPSGTDASQEQEPIELINQRDQLFHAFGLVENFTWKEFDDSGSELLKENGLLFGVGIKGELQTSDGQAQIDLLATVYGGNIDYNGQTMAGVPVKATTGYFGMKAEGMFSYRADIRPDNEGELTLKPGIGLGLRTWKRSLDNKGSFLGGNIGSMGYIVFQLCIVLFYAIMGRMKPYSIDLRERVVGFVKKGNTKADAARHFGICWKTVGRYVKAQRAGSLSPRPHGGGRRKKFTSEMLEREVSENSDFTLGEYAKALGVSHNAIWKRLRQLAITLKKNS